MIPQILDMKRIAPLVLFASLFAMLTATAQTDVYKDINVAKVYEQVVKEGYGTVTVYLKLANEYYFQNDYANARKWYEKVFEDKEKAGDKMLLFRYKQTLKALKINWVENPYLVTSLGTN
jgi:hypothetical protein